MNSGASSGQWSKAADGIAAGLIGLGAFCRILSYYFSTNSGGDAGAHVALAAVWLQHPTLKFAFGGYPPGHFWLIGLVAIIVHNVVAAGRLLSLVLGISSLFFVWKLARLLYGESAGLLSLAVFAVYSLHVAYSTTSSAEVSYLFFFLLGGYYFFLALRDRERALGKLALSGASLSIAESIRYEAWILFGGLFIILLVFLAKNHFRHWHEWLRLILAFGIAGGAWPLFMMAYSWHAFGDPMHLVTLNRLRVTSYLEAGSVSRAYQFALMPSALVISLSPVAVAGAIYGLACSFWQRFSASSSFASLTLLFAAVQAYELCTGGLLATARYTLTLGTMLAVVSGYGLDLAINKLLTTRIGFARGVVFGLVFLNPLLVLAGSELPNPYSEKLASVSPRLRYQKRIQSVAHFLRMHLGTDDAVVIDDYNVESNVIADAAGLPLVPGKRTYLLSRKNKISVDEYIRTEHPRFLVYANGGALQHWVPLPTDDTKDVEISGVQFHCVFVSPIYRVYELTYR